MCTSAACPIGYLPMERKLSFTYITDDKIYVSLFYCNSSGTNDSFWMRAAYRFKKNLNRIHCSFRWWNKWNDNITILSSNVYIKKHWMSIDRKENMIFMTSKCNWISLIAVGKRRKKNAKRMTMIAYNQLVTCMFNKPTRITLPISSFKYRIHWCR